MLSFSSLIPHTITNCQIINTTRFKPRLRLLPLSTDRKLQRSHTTTIHGPKTYNNLTMSAEASNQSQQEPPEQETPDYAFIEALTSLSKAGGELFKVARPVRNDLNDAKKVNQKNRDKARVRELKKRGQSLVQKFRKDHWKPFHQTYGELDLSKKLKKLADATRAKFPMDGKSYQNVAGFYDDTKETLERLEKDFWC